MYFTSYAEGNNTELVWCKNGIWCNIRILSKDTALEITFTYPLLIQPTPIWAPH